MLHRVTIAVRCILVALVFVGCASNKSTQDNRPAANAPSQVIIYDFAVTTHELPRDSGFARKYAPTTRVQKPGELTVSRDIAKKLAAELVQQLRGSGIPAVHGAIGRDPMVNELIIRGCLFSSDAKTAGVVMGASAGGARFGAAVEGYEMTLNGFNKLGGGARPDFMGLITSSEVNDAGRNLDAAVRAVAAELAAGIKQRFQEQRWIN